MKNKNLIVTGESSLGFVHGEHELKSQRIWDIRKTPCINYQKSIASLSHDEIYSFGLYQLEPKNIFNIETGEIKTTTKSIADMWLRSLRATWYELTTESYPIYDITNNYMGYAMYDKTHYTNLYKAKGNKYLAFYIEKRKAIFIIIVYFISLYVILTY